MRACRACCARRSPGGRRAVRRPGSPRRSPGVAAPFAAPFAWGSPRRSPGVATPFAVRPGPNQPNESYDFPAERASFKSAQMPLIRGGVVKRRRRISKRRHTGRTADPPRARAPPDPPARMRHTANVAPFGDPSRVRHSSATGNYRNFKKPENVKPGMVGAHTARIPANCGTPLIPA